MRVLIVSKDDSMAYYLQGQGHVAKTVYTNDIAVRAAAEYDAEAVIYCANALALEKHEKVVQELQAGEKRVILAAGKDNPVLGFAAALGITDLLTFPVDPAEILYRLQNPATREEAARLVRQLAEGKDVKSEPEEKQVKGFKLGKKKREEAALEIQNPASSFVVANRVSARPQRKRVGKPAAILGVGNARIDEWIKNNFSDQMDVVFFSMVPEDIKLKITELSPDICILMRQSSIGGIPFAGELAEWASVHVPVVVLIVGELDDEGKKIVDRAKNAGIRHLITCEKGGQVYGDELVYVLTTAIREIYNAPDQEKGGLSDKEAGKSLNSILYGVEILGKAIKQSAGIASEKAKDSVAKRISKPRINKKEGISLDEESETQAVINNLTNPTAIMPGGVLAVVSPWRPNLAGRLAAQAVKMFSEVEGSEVAYIGVSKNSTGALWLDVPDDVLMMSDWRVPGSNSPLAQDNLKIYAVDPAKNLSPNIEADLWGILKEARKNSTYTVMDFAGDIALAEKAAHQGRSVLLVVLPGNDPVEYKISSLWLRNVMDGKQNIVTGIDLRGASSTIPEGIRPGVVIRNNPADSLTLALKKISRDEFIWN